METLYKNTKLNEKPKKSTKNKYFKLHKGYSEIYEITLSCTE